MKNERKIESDEKIIHQGETLFDIYPDGIPSNAIINKILTGIGATYCQLNCPKASFIIEPNVPVIKGKKIDYPDLIVYYSGIDFKRVEKALQQNPHLPKKIKSCN